MKEEAARNTQMCKDMDAEVEVVRVKMDEANLISDQLKLKCLICFYSITCVSV